jgi:tRNA (5-methylaminomethyl-2-thiouridylate)-methyltransferase
LAYPPGADDESSAQYEATRPHTQQFERVKQATNLQQSGPVFTISSDFGRRVQVYNVSDEWTNESVPSDNKQDSAARTYWKGPKHVTVSHSYNRSIEETTRYLSFSENNDAVLVVERRCWPDGSKSNDTVIECIEVFEPMFAEGFSLFELYATNIQGVLASPLERVRGCVANVQVKTTLIPIAESMNVMSDCPQYQVWLDGEADAMISRGLLAMLSQGLAGGEFHLDLSANQAPTAEEVLAIDPDRVADYLGLRRTLTKGRNDGLASMMKVVQGQIRVLTGKSSDAEPLEQLKPAINASQERRPTVAMLLSGGVDSSVALNLLVRQGYDVTAFYLKIWLEDELAHLGQCPWEDDYRVCQSVCEQAGVPLETISLQNEYKDRVISYTVHEAKQGRTPNPDVMCNSRVKFGCFYDAIEGRGFDFVASGHYAQLDTDKENGVKRLLRAPDPIKDQSYFLCTLSQDQLQRVIFPIGNFEKTEVRELAENFDLPNKKRPDSQGLCFLGKVKFDQFLAAYLGERPGDILDAKTNQVIGRHNGVWYHTVGQRKGIGKVLDPLATSKGPWYVVAKDPERDIVFASNEYDEEAFAAARSDFFVEDIQWIAGSPPPDLCENGGFREGRFLMKIRHGPKLVQGCLQLSSETAGNVKLYKKDGGLAPGQYVVFYALDSPECLGGGVISERHWGRFLLDREALHSNHRTVS